MSALSDCLGLVHAGTRVEYALPEEAQDRLIKMASDKRRALDRLKEHPKNEIKGAMAVVQSHLDATRKDMEGVELSKVEASIKASEAQRAEIDANAEAQGFTKTELPPRTEAGFVQLPEHLKGALDHGIELVRNGLTDFAKWSVEMVKKFGEAIKAYLKDLWAVAQTRAGTHGQHSPGGIEERLEKARAAATRPNAPDSQSKARPLKDELGGAAQDYTAFVDKEHQAKAKEIVDHIGSVDRMARLLSSEQGVHSLGLSPDLQTYVIAETLKRAKVAADATTNDVDRIRATDTMRKVRALWDVTRTEAGQALVSSKLAGESMRDGLKEAMSVDEAIEKQQKTTIDKALSDKTEAVKQTVEKAAEDASTRATDELAAQIDAQDSGVAPDAPADQAAKIGVLKAQIDAYFGGNTPKRVKVIYDPNGESEAQLNNGALEVNAAAVSEMSTAEVTRMLEHEIGHGLFSDPAMREQFNTLWNSLDPLHRADIENEVAERYSAEERNEESSVRALDAVRAAMRGEGPKTAWERFKALVARLWQRFTGSMPKDPTALAARMIEVGVQRLRANKAGKGRAMSKRSDLLKTKSPALATLLNTLRKKIKVGMKWRDVFTALPSQQKAWELALYDRIRKHQALQALTPAEAVQLTREMSRAWKLERNKLFQRELNKQIAKVSGVKRAAAKKVSDSAPRLIQLINLGAFDAPAFRDAVAKEWGIKNMNSAEAKRLKDIGMRMQTAPEGVPRRKLAQQFIEGLQDLTKMTKAQILDSWWTAAVLSGWRTHVDIGLGILNGVEDVALGSIITAFRTGNADVAWRAIGALVKNLPTAMREAASHMATGDKSFSRKFDEELGGSLEDGKGFIGNAARQLMAKGGLYKIPGAFMEIISRALESFDHINSSSTREGAKMMAMARHPEIYKAALSIGPRERANARAQARMELTGGVKPKPISKERVQEDARVKEILEQGVPTEIMAEASEIGRAAALQGNPTGLGEVLHKMLRAFPDFMERKVGKAEKSGEWTDTGLMALRLASTFSKIVTGGKFSKSAGNFLNRSVSYVPGLGIANYNGNIRKPSAKGDILIAKQLMGTALAIGGILFHYRKNPDDDEEGIEGGWKGLTPYQKSELYAQGKQPNSVWYRDKEGKIHNYNYLQWGIGMMLTVVGSMEDRRRYHGDSEISSILVNSLANGTLAIGEKAQMQGLPQAIWADSAYSTSPGVGMAGRLNKWAANAVGGLVPRVIKDIDALASPELRTPGEWWTNWAAQLPMVREMTSGKRVNIFGEDIKLDRSPLSRVTQTGTADPAYRILGQLNQRDLWLADPMKGQRQVPTADGKGRDFTESEKDAFMRKTGEGYKSFIKEHGEDVLKMGHDDAKNYIKTFTKVIRDMAAYQAVGR